ncbi:MAG: hypothetical protein KDC38_13875 [Planctomycetes bacterium]|nr:hypothetical protein [Planctomycetota bacterium]
MTTSKTLRRAFLTVAVVFGIAHLSGTVHAQTILQFSQTFDVDTLGNATVKLHMEFNASQFQDWQRRYGMNPSLLRREMTRALTQYEITDFQIAKNDLEREVDVTIRAEGVARYMGDGRVELDVPKEWRLVNKSDAELKFTHLEPLGNGVSIQHFITANLPKEATDVSDPVPSFGGMNRFTYQIPATERSSMALIFGVVLILGGGGTLAAGLRGNKGGAPKETEAAS